MEPLIFINKKEKLLVDEAIGPIIVWMAKSNYWLQVTLAEKILLLNQTRIK